MITAEQLKAILPECKKPEEYATALNEMLPKYFISDKNQIAAFIAQCGHESAQFNVLQENLNYSTDALLRVFPKYFLTRKIAESYARNPTRIANRVYANRMGNGDESSGDGWMYRGKGLIQITGKSNTEAFAKSVLMDVQDAMNFMLTPEGSVCSACWYWYTNNLHKIDVSTTEGFKLLTKRINGGYNGLHEREALFKKAKEVL